MSWQLFTDRGQQVWRFVKGKISPEIPFDKKKNPNSGDKVYRQQCESRYHPLNLSREFYLSQSIPTFPSTSLAAESVEAELEAINFYQTLQMEDGHWPGDYGGPLFLLPGALITCYSSGILDSWIPEKKYQMIKYLYNHQNQIDGGWGLHIEAESTQFGTVMNYIALRLLGVPANDSHLSAPRKFILDQGGAMTAPSWCKFWLCVLNVADWQIYNSVFPEFWCFPEAFPLHPWRWWCHARMVYLPMAYIYAIKFQTKITPLIKELRQELYNQDYSTIKWSTFKDSISKVDLYIPQTFTLKLLNFCANSYELIHSSYLRRRASEFILSYIEGEDLQTKHIDIGPVNKFINMLSIYAAYGANDSRFIAHSQRVDDYFWLAEDGMKCQGYNGSQLWDTAFATQAIIESGVGHIFPRCLSLAHHYINISQVQENVPDRVKFYRHISNGGWPFSTLDHGWPISDCTGEGLKAVLALTRLQEQHGKTLIVGETIATVRLENAVNVLLSFQNDEGGWATYENRRAGEWMEWINPAEVFAKIMIDYSYVECTSAAITALAAFHQRFPDHRSREISESIKSGAEFVCSIQRSHGGWYGSWAVCFTYGTWFGIEGLIAAGYSSSSPEILKACQFLVNIQKADGGWGESYRSCVIKEYVEHESSQVVNTAWALLGLMKADYSDESVIERGIRLLLQRQQENGDWPQEGISGVFNGNCMITYTNYRNIFPIWAIGRYIHRCKLKQEAASKRK